MNLKGNAFVQSEFQLLNSISGIITFGTSEECAKLIKDHYASSELNGPWVESIHETLSAYFLKIKSIKALTLDEINRVEISFDAPEKSQYAGETYELEIDIPESYPSVPLECYIKQKIYHLNVEQTKEEKERYKMLIKSISP